MTNRAWADEYRTTIVCVDAYKEGVPSGRIYNRYLPDGKTFRCLAQFLGEMEQTLNKMDFPKAYSQVRTFGENPVSPPHAVDRCDSAGARATFAVRILFRQNASWQGSITWLEGKQEQSFRSALEMIFLINSALEYQQAS